MRLPKTKYSALRARFRASETCTLRACPPLFVGGAFFRACAPAVARYSPDPHGPQNLQHEGVVASRTEEGRRLCHLDVDMAEDKD
jgi:hypothetical protein